MPDLHVRIVSFQPEILTMSSLRKPKRLTMNGHDEREYRFLVKVSWMGLPVCAVRAS